MKSHKRGVIHVNLALAVLYLLGEVPLANAEDDCVPDAGGSGALKSVVLIIQQWESKFANFHVSNNFNFVPEWTFAPRRVVSQCLLVSATGGNYYNYA